MTNTGTVDADDVVLGFLVPPNAGQGGIPLQASRLATGCCMIRRQTVRPSGSQSASQSVRQTVNQTVNQPIGQPLSSTSR